MENEKIKLSEAGAEKLQALRSEYEYFPLPGALLVRDGAAGEESAQIASDVAVRATDAAAYAGLTSELAAEFAALYPRKAQPEAVSTQTALDTFFNTYGKTSPEEDALLEKLIFNPVPDYADVLAAEAEELPLPDLSAPADSRQARIDAFIAERSKVESVTAPVSEPVSAEAPGAAPVNEPDAAAADEWLLSESLAQMYIKRKRYDRAYEIISNLNLKYPKKSVYFADQLRFLRLLMENERRMKALKARNGAQESPSESR